MKSSLKMNREKRGPLALEEWARQLTDGYRGVTVRNMTTSWRNGLAFCALIHRFRPDLIEYEKLDPSDIIGNCSLAFEVAESKLGIPALLDPEDMAAHEVPDRLSVLTYVAQYYSAFKNAEKKSSVSSNRDDDDDLKNRSSDKSKSPSPEKNVPKRRMEVNEDEIMDAVRRNMPKRPVLLSSVTNVCSECQNPVYISERVLFMKKLYHRSCFRCSNCKGPLNPHTAEFSLDSLLFCNDNACHLELQRRSRAKFLAEHKAQILKDKEVEIIDNSSSGEVSCQQSEADDVSLSLSASVSGEIGDNSEHSFVSDRIPTPSSACDVEGARSVSPISIHLQVNHSSSTISNKSQPDIHHSQIQNESQDQDHMDIQLSPDSGQSSASDVIATQEKESRPPLPTVAQPNISERSLNEPSDILIIQQQPSSEESLPTENEDEQRSTRNQWLHGQIEDPLPEQEPDDVISTQVPETQSEDVNIKAASEIISIRDQAILTIADQISKTVPPQEETASLPEIVFQAVVKIESESTVTESNPQITKEDSDSTTDIPIPIDAKKEEDIVPENQEEEAEDKISDVVDTVLTVPIKVVQTPTQPAVSLNKSEKVTPSPKVKRRAPQPHSFISPIASSTPSPTPRVRGSNPTGGNSRTNSTQELYKKEDYYPTELNPFESEDNLEIAPDQNHKQEKQEPKNPFEDDDDEAGDLPSAPVPVPSPRHRNRNIPDDSSRDERLSPIANSSIAEVSQPLPPQPSPRKSVMSVTPKEYNPFEDDDDDIGEFVEDRASKPHRFDENSSMCSKISNGSSISGVPTPFSGSHNTSDVESSTVGSVRIKSRKNRRAPLPPGLGSPMATSTAANSPVTSVQPPSSPKSILKSNSTKTRIEAVDLTSVENEPVQSSPTTPQRKIIPASPDLLKGLKNKTNRVAAQQYKKKRRAPPPRRRVDPLPDETIRTELHDLEIKERELERQGITLESNIRRLMEQEETENDDNDSHGEQHQLDEMMIQLWGIVNEKNDILRRQTELEYLRRGHRLEEMQAELEFQLRVLMDTPLNQRQDDHAEVEQVLLDQMLKLVDERNEVVDWLDYHRKLDREEDLHVSNSLTRFATSNRHGGQNTVVEPIPDIVVSKSQSKSKKAEEKAIAKAKAKALKEASKKEKDKDKDHGSKLKLGLFTKRRSKKTKPDEDKDQDDTVDF